MSARPVLAVAVIAAAVVAVGSVALEMREHPVRSVRIAGDFRHVTKERLRAAIAPHLERSLLEVDVAAVRAAAGALPWVADLSVRRVWPDSLHVAITEREAVARWGEDGLLEADGTLFRPDTERGGEALPHLAGPEGAHGEVLERWRRVCDALAALGRPVRALELTARGGWRIELDGGAELVLGAAQDARALEHYARALPAVLRGRIDDVERVDMRYVNGFAVRYRDGAMRHASRD